MPGKPTAFDTHGVTFYAEPAFINDPVYGRYKDQMNGKVILLKEDTTSQIGKGQSADEKNQQGTMKPAVPEGWIMVKQGVVQNSKIKMPSLFIQLSKGDDVKVIAVDPAGPRSGYAFHGLQENPGLASCMPLNDEMLNSAAKADPSTKNAVIIENRIFNAFGKNA